jgi:hypothetical protein
MSSQMPSGTNNAALRWTRSDGLISDDSGESVAKVLEHDVLEVTQHWSDSFENQTIVIPCGSHKQSDPEPSAVLLSQWSQDSWEPFNEAMDRILELASNSNTRVVVLPGAGGRLSDAICTLSWAASHQSVPLLIDPAGWLTPSMMGDLKDHLIRFTTLCDELPNIWGVVVRSVQTESENRLVHAAVGSGLIDQQLLKETIGTIPTSRVIECD